MDFGELVRLQHAFDVSRGFAELPFAPGGGGADARAQLSKLEFALMGLAGEVGEVAGILKRARRNEAQTGAMGPAAFAGLNDEIADILSYVLKLAHAAGIESETGYLAKMAVNAHRFRSPESAAMNATSLCGPPGSGKTTVARVIAEQLPAHSVYVERFEENPHLGDIQAADQAFDADASQSWFLRQVGAFLNGPRERSIVLDQDPTAIALIYSQLLVDQGRLSREALGRHMGDLMQLEVRHSTVLACRRVILLDAPAAILAERSEAKFGAAADEVFLGELRGRFSAIFANLPNTVVVDASAPPEKVVEEVRRILAG
jgi:thymidylate kinase/NTP pyrophosphatase (non-canonical NTP hydrolase)